MKNKKIVTALAVLLALIIAGVACWFIFSKPSTEDKETAQSAGVTERVEVSVTESETDNVTDEPAEDTADAEINDNGEVLEFIEYGIINPKRVMYSDEDQWILVRYDGVEANKTGDIPIDDRITVIDDSLASLMDGYEYSFIRGYYHDDAFFTSIISDKVLKINKVDLTSDDPTYDVFVDLPMPEGYELSGLWEGERLDNDCIATILDMDGEKIYFHTVGEEYTEDIYLLDLDDMSITKLDSSPRYGPHSRPRAYKYGNYLILKEDTGYYLIDKSAGADFETVLGLDPDIGGFVGEPCIRDGELYFTFDNTDYNNDPPNEIHKEYKYNFDTKTLTEVG